MGNTASTDHPTTSGAYDRAFSGNEDIVVISLDLGLPYPPTPPRDLDAKVQEDGVHLLWEAPADIGTSGPVRYDVFRGYDPYSLVAVAEDVQTTEYDDVGLTPGATYHYAVRALNDIGPSRVSNVANAMFVTLPSPPVDLSASAGPHNVLLSWDAPSSDGGVPLLGYQVWRGGDGLGSSQIASTGPSQTDYNDTSVVQGVEYFYNVAAINIRGPSPLSPVAAATPMDRPDPPSDLEVVSGDGYALLTWGPPISDGGSPLLAYEIWRSGSDGPGPTFSLDPRETRFNDTGLTNGVTYNYHMTSRNMAGRSGPTKELSIVAAGLPGPPRDLRARSGNGYVLLTWLPPLDDGGFEITGIEIFRSRDGSDPSEIGEVHGTSSAFNDTEAENGHRYTYWIAAVTSIGASSLEGPAEGAPIGPPDPPSDVRAIPGDHFVLIYWSPPSNDGGASVDRYSVLRGMTPRSMRAIASVGNGTFVYNDTSVTNGIAYFYSVRAFNPFYGSDTPAGLAAEPLGLPTPPTDIAAELVPGLARVTWNPPSDDGGSPVELYRIVRTSDADDGAGSFELGPGILNFLDANVTRPGTVYYSLACRNRVGWSENGETVSITISGVPGKVGSVKALLSEGVVTITWDPPVGPSSDCSYKVYRTAEGSDPLLIGTTHGPQTSFRDTSPSPGRSSYFVRAVNERGMGDPSDRAEVEVPSAGTERDDGWAMTAISVVLLALSCCLLIAWLVRRRK